MGGAYALVAKNDPFDSVGSLGGLFLGVIATISILTHWLFILIGGLLYVGYYVAIILALLIFLHG